MPVWTESAPIEAALFALRSPLAKGVLLAEDRGGAWEDGRGRACSLSVLGGERRKLLVILLLPHCVKRWGLEFFRKAHVPSGHPGRQDLQGDAEGGHPNPFIEAIIITSLHYGRHALT